jgi:hydrogenase nickel incorporation protein HypB
MCATCGCSDHDEHEHSHEHEHVHADGTRHTHAHGEAHHDHHHRHEVVSLELRVLAKNDALAQRNRDWFAERDILAINLLSAPGAGKTTLLERTIRDVGGEIPISVLEGDQATTLDGDRIRKAGVPAVQINTGTGCHLDAHMVAHGVERLAPPRGSLLLIENVGNLVCPALFDLGEQARVVIVSVTEGDDKPQKYPHMFRRADMLLINKIDLLPYVRFDVDRCIGHAREINPMVQVLRVSAETGEGMADWYQWLAGRRDNSGAAA